MGIAPLRCARIHTLQFTAHITHVSTANTHYYLSHISATHTHRTRLTIAYTSTDA